MVTVGQVEKLDEIGVAENRLGGRDGLLSTPLRLLEDSVLPARTMRHRSGGRFPARTNAGRWPCADRTHGSSERLHLVRT